MRHFCTCFDRRYLSRGLVLHESLRAHSRTPFVLWVLCLDAETHRVLSSLQLPDVRLIALEAFEAGDTALLRAKAGRRPVEYYWTCTPSLPLYVLRQDPAIDVITYLDADQCFYADPQPVFDALGPRAVLIIEHRYAPAYAASSAIDGIYNVGLMTFRRNAAGLACLHWWRERCLEWCFAYHDAGRFGDQKYLDDWPARFEDVVVLPHPGVGLAPWNLPEAGFRVQDGHLWTADQPVVLYHFQGFARTGARTARPASARYDFTHAQIEHLYVPYARALEDAARRVSLSPVDRPTSWWTQCRGLLTQHLFLTSAPATRARLWRWGARHKTIRRTMALVFRAYAHDGGTAARRLLWQPLRRNPLWLSSPTVWAILLEPIIGRRLIGAGRRLARRLRPRAGHGGRSGAAHESGERRG